MRAAAYAGAAQITASASIESPLASASRQLSVSRDIATTSARLRIDAPSRVARVSGSVAIPFLKLWNRLHRAPLGSTLFDARASSAARIPLMTLPWRRSISTKRGIVAAMLSRFGSAV
jgi:hypothetical protein